MIPLSNPIVAIKSNARKMSLLKDNDDVNSAICENVLVKIMIMGCTGSLKRGVYMLCPMLVDAHSDLGH